MTAHRWQWQRPVLAALGSMAVAGGVFVTAPAAAYVDWTLNGSVGYDDNPGRVSQGSSGSATVYGGGTLTVDEHRPRLDAVVGANLGYLDYLSGNYRGQIVGSAQASARYAISPKTLFWSVDDTFGQGAVNALAPSTPENRTNVNIFSTGPTLILPLNSVVRLSADGRIGIDTYSTGTQPNDTRYSGSLGLIRQLSPLSTASLNGEYLQVDYTGRSVILVDPLLPSGDYYAADYSRESAFARYTTSDKRNTFSVDLGASKVRQDGQTFSSPLARLNLSRKVSAYWTVGLTAGHEFTDGAQNFAAAVGSSGLPLPDTNAPGVAHTTQSVPLTNQPLKTDSGTANATWQATRTTFQASATLAHDQYLLLTESNDRRESGTLSVSRRLTPHSDLHLGAYYETRNFVNVGTVDHTTFANATYSWQFDGAFRGYASYNYERRSSTTGIYSYTDNRVSIGVIYAPVHHTIQPPATFGLPR